MKKFLKVVLVLCLLLVVAGVGGYFYMMSSGFQTKMVNQLLAGSEAFEADVDRVEATLNSVHLEGVSFNMDGLKATMDGFTADVPLLKAVFSSEIHIDGARTEGLVVDISNYAPNEDPDEEQTPFEGVLTGDFGGYKLYISDTQLTGDIIYPENREGTVKIAADGIAPGETGAVSVVAGYADGSAEAQIAQFQANANIKVTQRSTSGFSAVVGELTTTAQGAAIAGEQTMEAAFAIKATESGESYDLVVAEEGDPQTQNRLIDVTATFDPTQRRFSGKALLNVRADKIEQMLVGLSLPQVDANGDLNFTYDPAQPMTSVEGTLTASASGLGELVPELQGVGPLSLDGNVDISADADTTTVNTFNITLKDAQGQTVLLTESVGQLVIGPDGVRGGESELLRMQLQGLPVEWINPFVSGAELSGGAMTGAFTLTPDIARKRFSLTPTEPLTVNGLAVGREGEVLLSGLDLTLNAPVTYSPELIRIENADFTATQNGAQVATARVDVTATNAQGQLESIEGEGTLNIDLARLRNQPGAAGLESLPQEVDSLSASFDVSTTDGAPMLNEMQATISAQGGRELLALRTLQAFPLSPARAGGMPSGDLMRLTLNNLPVAMIDPFIEGYELTGGTIAGAFNLQPNIEAGSVRVTPVQPLQVNSLNVAQNGDSMLRDVSVRLAGPVFASADRMVLEDGELFISSGGQTIADAEISATVESVAAGAVTQITSKGQFNIDLQRLKQQPVGGRMLERMPATVARATGEFAIEPGPQGAPVVRQLDLAVRDPQGGSLASITALKPFPLGTDPERHALPEGDLLRLSLNNLPVSLVDSLVEGYSLTGGTVNGAFNIRPDLAASSVELRPQQPLRISNLSVQQEGEPMLQDVTLSASTPVYASPSRIVVEQSTVEIASGGNQAVNATFTATVQGLDTEAAQISSNGNFTIHLAQLKTQPMLAEYLAQMPDDASRVTGNYTVAPAENGNGPPLLQALNIDVLNTRGNQLASAKTLQPFALSTEAIKPTGDLASVTFTGFPVGGLIPAIEGYTMSMGPLQGQLQLRGRQDGAFVLSTPSPLEITNLNLSKEGEQWFTGLVFEGLAQVVISLDGTRVELSNMKIKEERISLIKDGQFTMTEGGNIDTSMSVYLVELFKQPFFSEQSGFVSGAARIQAQYTAGETTSTLTTNIEAANLVPRGAEPGTPPIPKLNVNNGKFTFGEAEGVWSAMLPITLQGESSQATIQVEHAPSLNPGPFQATLNGQTVVLDDVMALVSAFTGPEEEGPAQPAPPDEKAVWADAFQGVVNLDIQRLLYFKNMSLDALKGKILIDGDSIEFQDIRSRLDTAQGVLTGVINFQEQQKVYDVDLGIDLPQFNLGAYLAEGIGQQRLKPFMEGYFDVNANAQGALRSLGEIGDKLPASLSMNSTQGTFRLEDNRGLMGNLRSFAAAGSLLSGLLGEREGSAELLAVFDIANAISELQYNQANLKIVRDASLNIRMEQFLIRAPFVQLQLPQSGSVEGQIMYSETVPLNQRQIQLPLQILVKGNMADAMANVGLLQSAQANEEGFVQGPTFTLRGSLAKPDSSGLYSMLLSAGRTLLQRGDEKRTPAQPQQPQAQPQPRTAPTTPTTPTKPTQPRETRRPEETEKERRRTERLEQ